MIKTKCVGQVIVTLLIPVASFAQNTDSLFEVSKGVLAPDVRTKIEKQKKTQLNLYEDGNYIVRATCSGEWGGSIWFKNKGTGIEYSASATCPVSVNKINDKYYVTNSLAHLSGSCEILEISQPDSMEIFQLPPPRKQKGKKVYRFVGDDESKSRQGTRKVIDSHSTLALGSFVLNGDLFHIITDDHETFVARIVNQKFEKVKFITSEQIFTYDDKIVTTEDGHIFLPISGGYLEVFENRIAILKNE